MEKFFYSNLIFDKIIIIRRSKLWEFDEYVCRVMWFDDNYFGGKKKDLLLNDLMNVNYMYVLMFVFDLIDNWSLLFGLDKLYVRFISFWRKVWFGIIIEYDKLSRFIRDCRFFNVVDFLWNIFFNVNLVFFDFVNR